jgi:hypothetical protein
MSDEDLSDPMDEDMDEEDYDVDEDFGSDNDDVDYQDYVGDMGLSSSQEIRRQKSYEVLSEDELTARSQELINEVKDVLGIEEKSTTLLLLRYFKFVLSIRADQFGGYLGADMGLVLCVQVEQGKAYRIIHRECR